MICFLNHTAKKSLFNSIKLLICQIQQFEQFDLETEPTTEILRAVRKNMSIVHIISKNSDFFLKITQRNNICIIRYVNILTTYLLLYYTYIYI